MTFWGRACGLCAGASWDLLVDTVSAEIDTVCAEIRVSTKSVWHCKCRNYTVSADIRVSSKSLVAGWQSNFTSVQFNNTTIGVYILYVYFLKFHFLVVQFYCIYKYIGMWWIRKTYSGPSPQMIWELWF